MAENSFLDLSKKLIWRFQTGQISFLLKSKKLFSAITQMRTEITELDDYMVVSQAATALLLL